MTTINMYDVVSNRETRNGSSAQDLWDACSSPIFRVVDEEGNNVADCQIRHLLGKSWLCVDDMDGYQILDEADVANLNCLAE